MQDEFGDEPAKSKTRSELQDDLRKYGITPRPGYDSKGPNLPDNVPDPSTTREKYRDKAKTRAIENEDFKDKRTPKSDLIRQAELDKMKEILKMPKGPSGGGGGGGSGDLEKGMMGGRFKPLAKAKGGSVSSASKRADGCCIRGKTRA